MQTFEQFCLVEFTVNTGMAINQFQTSFHAYQEQQKLPQLLLNFQLLTFFLVCLGMNWVRMPSLSFLEVQFVTMLIHLSG